MLSISTAFMEKAKRLKVDNPRTQSKLCQEKLSISNVFAQSHSY